MSCDDAQALLLDALVQQRLPNDAAFLTHLDSCIACRTARAEYETLWREMGRLVAPVPSPDARARFAIRLGTLETLPISLAPWCPFCCSADRFDSADGETAKLGHAPDGRTSLLETEE